MDTLSSAAIIFLTALCVILTYKSVSLKKNIKKIRNDTETLMNNNTNRLITVSSADKELRALASSLNVQLRSLREKELKYDNGDKELKNAITGISHDLRTPLTAILGYIELLKNEPKSKKAEEYLSVIENRAKAMKELTNELFSYTVLTAPEKEPVMKEEDVRRILEESIAQNYVLLTDNCIKPEILIPEKPVILYTDSRLLKRVFTNIISNAAKYSDGDFKIELTDDVTITFENSAGEISETEVGRLFERFYTVEDGRKSTGLGLSIAKHLTEQLGGKIYAELKNKKLIIRIIL